MTTKKHKQAASHLVRAAIASPPPDAAATIAKHRRDNAPMRLVSKAELLKRVPYSFPTLWHWMAAGNFPRSRIIGQKTVWIEFEIEEWIANLPVGPIKEDA